MVAFSSVDAFGIARFRIRRGVPQQKTDHVVWRGFALIAVRKRLSAASGGGVIGVQRGFRLLNRRPASAGLQVRAGARSERADADLAYPADHHQVDPGLEHLGEQAVEDEELGQGYCGVEDVITVPVGWAARARPR